MLATSLSTAAPKKRLFDSDWIGRTDGVRAAQSAPGAERRDGFLYARRIDPKKVSKDNLATGVKTYIPATPLALAQQQQDKLRLTTTSKGFTCLRDWLRDLRRDHARYWRKPVEI
jgi:hypothetical protein